MSTPAVSLVIPGKNCSRTIRPCLEAVVPLRGGPEPLLAEIIFVDDGSTDDSAKIVAEFPVQLLKGPGGGPGAARNIGWRAARCPLVWFIDSDCVAEPDALPLLLGALSGDGVAGVGGSYSNRCPESLLACLIHEEIAERHRRMGREVDFLGGFNVVYRRAALEAVGGFDEKDFNGPGSPGAEDAELTYRLHKAGYALRFEPLSRVGHYHPTRLMRYLRAQRHHGYWRVNLHLRHPGQAAGDAYSNLVDNAQPPLAMMSVAGLPLVFSPSWWWLEAASLSLLGLAQVPMTARLLWRTGRLGMLWFAPMGLARAFARGFGMTACVVRNGLGIRR
jgi:glycosyltransferase involved in cell wall biosynthesis